ncbi:hypothetical protein D3C71_2219930 [compost metagenome]
MKSPTSRSPPTDQLVASSGFRSGFDPSTRATLARVRPAPGRFRKPLVTRGSLLDDGKPNEDE